MVFQLGDMPRPGQLTFALCWLVHDITDLDDIEAQMSGHGTASFGIAGKLLNSVKIPRLYQSIGFCCFRDYIDGNRRVYHFSSKSAEICICAYVRSHTT